MGKRIVAVMVAAAMVLAMVPMLAFAADDAPEKVWVDASWGIKNNGDMVGTGKKIGGNAFAKIQEAVDGVAQGGTVYVAAGDYNEAVIIDTEGITIQGPTTGTVKLTGTVRVRARTVSLRHLEIAGGVRLAANGGKLQDLKITGGSVFSGERAGVYIDGGTKDHTLLNNNLAGPGKEVVARGVLLGYDVSNIAIVGNRIEGWRSGIYLNPVEKIVIQNNSITDNYAGIGGNGMVAVTVIGNDILSNHEGMGSSNTGEKVVVTNNNFVGNETGLRNYSGTGIDARNNWWGDKDGPTSAGVNAGDEVIGTVNYVPWLVQAARYSGYSLSITGADKVSIDNPVEFQVRTIGDKQGTVTHTAIYDYSVSGGKGKLEYYDSENKSWRELPLTGQFGPRAGFELAPDWDETTGFRFTAQEGKTYQVSITLRTMNGQVLATATKSIEAIKGKVDEDPKRIGDENVQVRIVPRTFNLKSNGVMTILVTLPGSGDVEKVWVNSEEIKTLRTHGNVKMLSLKLSRQEVANILDEEEGNQTITVKVQVDGTVYEGSDTIRIINPGPPAKERSLPAAAAQRGPKK